jgi:hypothetical protein
MVNLGRRTLRVTAWALALACLLLVIVWAISTRWYVYANVVDRNGIGKEGPFAGFTGGCLVAGV